MLKRTLYTLAGLGWAWVIVSYIDAMANGDHVWNLFILMLKIAAELN